MALTPELASSFARTALANVAQEYPAKLDHVMGGPADVRGPRELHPAFYGSFDWHSCVHMHWTLARVRRLHPSLPERAAIDDVFDAHLHRAQHRGGVRVPRAAGVRRLRAHVRVGMAARACARAARRAMVARAAAPLTDALAARYVDYLPRQRYPLRQGLHPNSAFGLAFAIDYADAAGDAVLRAACVDAAHRWFARDRDAPVAWEPSGIDFLSPALMEADLMRRVLGPRDFSPWLDAFVPGGFALAPVAVDDRSDGYIVHLDGLNLSRAWCMEGIARALPRGGSARRDVARVRDRPPRRRHARACQRRLRRRALARDVRNARADRVSPPGRP